MDQPLSDTEVNRFHQQGYVICRTLFDEASRADLVKWVTEVSHWEDSHDRWLHHREETPSGNVLARTENFVPFHQGLGELLTRGAVQQAVSQLFGEPASLMKEKINYKYPGGGGYAAHQDIVAYKFGGEHITCLVAVDDSTVANGCLEFAAGRHQEGVLPMNDVRCITPECEASLTWSPAEARSGEVVFFSSFAPHRSGANTSANARRGIYATFNKASDGDLRTAYYEDKLKHFAEKAAAGEKPQLSQVAHFQGRTIG